MKKRTLVPSVLTLLIGMVLSLGLLLRTQPVGAEETSASVLPQGEIARLVAPIALYPDTLLSQILMAATYPIEVIEADRWVRDNARLRSDALDRALLEKGWDPSVKALCHFPTVLALMSERIADTTLLGNAFLAQEGEVMDMIQELRAEAYARGNLNSTSQQRVAVSGETIVIEPVDTRIVYVPYYDPLVIYGSWWYPAYRPYYWGPPGVSVGLGISFWPGVYFGYSFSNWSYFNWHHHHIHVDVHKRPRYARHDHWYSASGRWQHSPVHRHGIAYHDRDTARRFGDPLHRSGEFRRDGRGGSERQEIERDRTRRGDERPGVDRGRRSGSDARLERGRQPEQPRVRQEQTRVRKEQLRSAQESQRVRQEPLRRGSAGIGKQRDIVADERQKPVVIRENRRQSERAVQNQSPRPAELRKYQAPQRIESRREQAESRRELIRRGGEVRNERQIGERSGFYRQERNSDLRDRGVYRSGGNLNGGNRGGREGGRR